MRLNEGIGFGYTALGVGTARPPPPPAIDVTPKVYGHLIREPQRLDEGETLRKI